MRRIKLIIEYDGTHYAGWQRQKNGDSIQQEIEKAIEKTTREKVKIQGSGRTDAGVHALGQVAHFDTLSKVPDEKFSYALNTHLPKDIAIIHSVEVNTDFHARYSATGKHYRYILFNQCFPSPLMRDRAAFIRDELDIEKMKTACHYLIGTHDFRCFMAAGSQVQDTVRTIYQAQLEQDGHQIVLDLVGSGFLYHMVRIIAGTLVDMGTNKKPPHAMTEIIAHKRREEAGKTMPAEGLYLMEVFYE